MRRLAITALLILSACGGSSNTGGAKAPEPTGAPPPSPSTTTEGTTKAEGALEPVETRNAKAQASFDEAQTAFSAAGNDCAQLCKALGSMSRATEHLCDLAKENGDNKRCTDATTRLETARAKVKSSCGGCE